jgi:two-component system response regulator YesN
MYHAMVVEDSKPILRNIVQQIESMHARVRVVATASNGKQALARLSDTQVDIVFSDIKMPILGGLDFLGEAKTRRPGLRCVIISGYDDFEFARQAIQLGVDEYILKPVTPNELMPVLNRIVASLDQRTRQTFQNELAKALKRGDTAWKAPNDLLRGAYGICFLRFWRLRDGSWAPDVANIREAFGRASTRDECLSFAEARGRGDFAVIADLEILSEERWKGICSRVFESLSIQGQLGWMACSSGHTDVAALPSQVNFLSMCLEQNVPLDTPTLLWADSMPEAWSAAALRDEVARFKEEAGLITGGQSGDEFRMRLEDFVSSWRDRKLPLIVVRQLLRVMLDAIDAIAGDSTPPRDGTAAVEELLERTEGYGKLVGELCRVYQAAIERNRESKSSLQNMVGAALEFFRSNLGRNISMSDVAARLGFSLSYIHRVLHSALGKAPMEYYIEMKVQEAKRLLEQYPCSKVKDIAESLGFQDQHYFSRVFKTHVSLSPIEYRERFRQERL